MRPAQLLDVGHQRLRHTASHLEQQQEEEQQWHEQQQHQHHHHHHPAGAIPHLLLQLGFGEPGLLHSHAAVAAALQRQRAERAGLTA